jgi:hypothetical protein
MIVRTFIYRKTLKTSAALVLRILNGMHALVTIPSIVKAEKFKCMHSGMISLIMLHLKAILDLQWSITNRKKLLNAALQNTKIENSKK